MTTRLLPLILIALALSACSDAVDTPPPTNGGWDVVGSNSAKTTAPRDSKADAPAPASQPVSMSGPQPGTTTSSPDGPPRSEWASYESAVVDLVNQVRKTGTNCGEYGDMPPVAPMTSSPALRAAARDHSADMADHDFLDHAGSDGKHFWDRAAAEGYQGTPRGEDVAGGWPTPEAVVAAFTDSDEHCMIMMLPETTDIGVGYSFRGDTTFGHFWTLDTGIAK